MILLSTYNYLTLLVLLFNGCTQNIVQLLNEPKSQHYKIKNYSIENMNEVRLTSGQIITYKESGEGSDILLLIHGLGSNHKAWNKLTPLLEDKYKLIAIDLPQYLDQEKPGPIGMMAYAKMVKEFIDIMGIQNANIVGHSMGGQISLHLASSYPESVNKLILIAPAGIETFSLQEREWFFKIATKEYYSSLNDTKIEQNFNINFSGGKMPADARFMYEDRLKIKADSTQYSRYLDWYTNCVYSMLNEPIFDKLEEIKTPTLVLYGSDDYLIPNKILHPKITTENILEYSKALPRSTQVLISNAGHFLQWDQPERVSEEISNLLDH